MAHDGNWLLLNGTETYMSLSLWNFDISAQEDKVSPSCHLRNTGFCMFHLNKFVNTIKGIIKCFGILARASSKLLDNDLQVIIDQLGGILLRLGEIVEEGDLSIPPPLTYCRQRRDRLIFPHPREALQRDNEVAQGQGQIELVPIVRLRIHLGDQTESVNNQVLESVIPTAQTQVVEIDIDSDSDVPDLIDSRGNIVN